MPREEITREKFAALVERHHRDLVRLAFVMCGDRAMAEDAAQACWQAAWQHRSDIRDFDHARGWLFTVTANNVRRQLRRRRLGEILQGTLTPGPPVEVDARFVDLAAALRSLPVRDRQLVAMKYGLGLTSEEIGHSLGLSSVGVRRRLQSVLLNLRRELDDA